MSKPRILFIMHMPPPVHGAAIVGQQIKESLYINSQFDCYYINASISQNVGNVGKFRLRKIWYVIGVLIKTFRVLIIKRPQLCYFTAALGEGPGIYTNFAVVALLKLFRRKIVLHLHNQGCKRALSFGKKYHYAYSFIFRECKVILLAPSLYKDVEDYVDYTNVYICPNGIEKLNDKQKTIYNELPHILFLSNLLIEKGVYVLLDSLSHLHQKGIDFVCNIVGNETLAISASQIKQEISARNLSEKVFYLGKRYGQDKEACYQGADIFVFPSYCDAFGLVLLEAMQHHLPCISTYEGGIPFIVDHKRTGLLCQSKNVEELSEAIYSLLTNKELRIAMGEAGFEKYKSNFTLQHFEKNLTRIFTSIIQED